jgi:transposase
MNLDLSTLPDDTTALKGLIFSLASAHTKLEKEYQSRIEFLEERIRLFQNELFGRKSEKRPVPESDQRQLLLFNEAESAVGEEKQKPESITIPAHTRKKSGRKPLPPDLPRIDVIHDLPEAEKMCDCGVQMDRIGVEESEKLDIIPAKMQVIRHIRYKYACKNCEGVESEGPTVKIAPTPAQIIPKGIATPGLLAHILTSKFEDALPFYRQEKIFARLGVEIPRPTMCGWAMKVAEQCEPLLALLHHEIRSGPLINIDETPVQVFNEPGRSNTSQSYMWVFRGGVPDKPVLMYQYHPTRSGQVPGDFLKNYRGYIQTDGYNGYDALGRRPGVYLVGCWAHVRRKFVEVTKAASGEGKKGHADIALEYIRKLYAVEKSAREQKLKADQIVAVRREHSAPVLAELKIWLESLAGQTPPKGLLGKAVNYALKNWPLLIRYLENGHITPDNNAAENAIRPFVLGRKNWLFAGHPNGAHASAALFSLIETAKANKLKPYFYVRYIFERLPLATTEADYMSLLPQNLKADQIELATGSGVY